MAATEAAIHGVEVTVVGVAATASTVVIPNHNTNPSRNHNHNHNNKVHHQAPQGAAVGHHQHHGVG